MKIRKYTGSACAVLDDGTEIRLRASVENYVVLTLRYKRDEEKMDSITVLCTRFTIKDGRVVVTRVDGTQSTFDVPDILSCRQQQTVKEETLEADRGKRFAGRWKNPTQSFPNGLD